MITGEVMLKITTQELYAILESIEKLKELLSDNLIEMEVFLNLLENAVQGETITLGFEEIKRKTKDYCIILYQIGDLIKDLQEIANCYECAEAAEPAAVVPSDTLIFDDTDIIATTIPNPASPNHVTSEIHYCKAAPSQDNETTECFNKKESLDSSPTNDSFDYGDQAEVSTGSSKHSHGNTQPEAHAYSSSISSDAQGRYYSSNIPAHKNKMSRNLYSPKSTSAASPISALLDFFKAPFAIAGSLLTVNKNKHEKENIICREYLEDNNKTRRLTEQEGLYDSKKELAIQSVQFSALAPSKMKKGDYSLLQLLMYEDEYRNVVDRILSQSEDNIFETPGGELCLRQQSAIMIRLVSPDIKVGGEMLSLEESRIWQGGYQNFTFAVLIPFDYDKRQIIFKADVYINDLIASTLTFITTVDTDQDQEQKIKIQRNDIMSAFVSYASNDRARVAAIIQGMKKARPDLDIFMDVDKLRSGEQWETVLKKEIVNRDIFYLCWSLAARESSFVEMEWRYALDHRGLEYIEPVPIDPPNICPPPDELSSKHFNDRLIYLIRAAERFPLIT